MSIYVSYYFNMPSKPTNLSDLAAQVNKALGCHLQPQEGNLDIFSSIVFDIELILSMNTDSVNDRDLEFEAFDYCLDARTFAGHAYLRPIQLPMMMLNAFALFSNMQITGMLVFDSQILLARYSSRPAVNRDGVEWTPAWYGPLGLELLFDSVSDRTVHVADHLHDLLALAPRNMG